MARHSKAVRMSALPAREALATSKSFRAVLPSMAGDDIDRLRRYCDANCAASAVFLDGPGNAHVVWLATRDRTRTAAAHRRSARAVLGKLRNSTAGLKGAWLVLAADEAVRAAAAEHRVRRPSEIRAPRVAVDKARRPPPGIHGPCNTVAVQDASGSDVKVIELGQAGGPCRGGTAQFSVEVLR